MNTRASEIMSAELLTAKEGITVEEALRIMINSRITGMPVVDAKGKMIGVLSEYDLIKQMSEKGRKEKKDPKGLFKKPAMYSKEAFSITEDTPLSKIVEHFVESRFRRVPVTNKSGKLVGIITRRDLMRVFYYRAQLEALGKDGN